MTLLVAIGQPWSVALAANVKLFPILIGVWWLGRRNFQAVGALVAWMLIFGVFQLLLEPSATFAFFSAVGLDQVAGVQNLSPYAISPILWVVLVGAGGLAALVLAPTRWGWAAAVALSTLASPRLLLYMLSGLLAAVREPRTSTGDRPAEPRGYPAPSARSGWRLGNRACIDFVARVVGREEAYGKDVLEVGSYDTTGTVRPRVVDDHERSYLGVDISAGPSVDARCRRDDTQIDIWPRVVRCRDFDGNGRACT